MTVTKVLRRAYGWIRHLVKPEFNTPIKEQQEMLFSYPDPEDDIERSFFQYKLTMKTIGKWFSCIINIASVFLIPYYILILKRNYKKIVNEEVKECDGVFLSDGIIFETIPDSLRNEFPDMIMENFTDNMCLSQEDTVFLKEIFRRYPMAFHFQLKSLMKIGIYSAQIIKHNPKAIISYTESSFSSSIATYFCEGKNVEHINIMHGERYFELYVSFFRFSRFYVWNQYYVDLFSKLRAEISQFIIEIPKILRRELCMESQPKYYMTYYLSDENKEALLIIRMCFDILRMRGEKCALRIHPRGENWKLVRGVFNDYDIEESKVISMKQSLENTKYVASLRSTVLFEGYCNGKEVILDDCSNISAFEKLKELDYIMLKKPHKLLSDIIKEEQK